MHLKDRAWHAGGPEIECSSPSTTVCESWSTNIMEDIINAMNLDERWAAASGV